MIQPKSGEALAQIDVELKEAVCDALVNMVTRRASGTDDAGRYVYGKSPRRGVFSGQLLPRLSRTNQDETSDIKIAAIGMDFNVSAKAVSNLTAAPRFSVYVRVLPTWEEISSDRYGIEIDFKLSKETKSAIDEKIKERREALYASGNLVRLDWVTMDPGQKDEFYRRRREIQDQLRRSVYGEFGITLRGDEVVSFAKEDAEVPAANGTEGNEETTASPDIGKLITKGRSIPTQHVSPAPIPGKWRRLDLKLPVFEWAASLSGDALKQKCEDYSIALRSAIATQLTDWLKGEEGKWAWRNRTVRPDEARSEASWNAFIDALKLEPLDASVLPDLTGLELKVERQRDFIDPSRVSIRVSLDNSCAELNRRDAAIKCNALFGTELKIGVDKVDHRTVQLDRVEPSYRFRDFLSYPAIGLNCGIVATDAGDTIEISTTWAPRFTQPRIVARDIEVECRFSVLAKDHDVSALLVLPSEYGKWIDRQIAELSDKVVANLPPDEAARERKRFEEDVAGQRSEAKLIERGIRILVESRAAALALPGAVPSELSRLQRKAAPWNAWLMTNESFARRDRDPERKWRLFQLAFILAHIPTFASRMEEYANEFEIERDEEAASLLYFPTGGGKSEAFYGALLFAIFLDRLRGKDRGITAMIRYPLRLLTLQQAQRLLRLVVWAEIVRQEKTVGSWPIEIGFWVGSSNTPNRFSEMQSDLPTLSDHPDDSALEDDTGKDKRANRYREVVAAYNKVSRCPCCSSLTGLRRYAASGAVVERAAIVCFNAKCEWNKAHGELAPLPFLLTDDTIYQRAPAIVLGTVDKLAMLGQSTPTITEILGMFGMGRWVDPAGHLRNPRKVENLQAGPEANGMKGVFPSYAGGEKVFFDPFPSLIIQDEAHLLEDSLGTFSGLFDTLLEKTFKTIDRISGASLGVSRYTDKKGDLTPRLPKIVAATATISDPDRQLKVLYQRKPLRFPYPGPDIYHSFFAEPAKAPKDNAARLQRAAEMDPARAPEATAPWMRLYVSLMTNDATHTVTTVGVLSAFHTVISHLWSALLDPSKSPAAIAELRAAVSDDEGGEWRRAAIDRAIIEGRTDDVMALIDLHRIALAYVTNKKGGDQVIDALHSAVAEKHRTASLPHSQFISRLISGGVDMQEIQSVMKEAETPFGPAGYPDVGDTLRSIVATSAISHGVDVDRFNSMFFAGLPSDIAEYIQASSRVGRSHVGFVMLLPTPQSRRDRYVIETHDIFHRFLERMISPPAVERWAETAIDRVTASYVQTWAMLKDAEAFLGLPDSGKFNLQSNEFTTTLGYLAKTDLLNFANDLGGFMLDAMGANGRGAGGFGSPPYRNFYHDSTDRAAQDLGKSLRSLEIELRLQKYWEQAAKLRKPMTSLRDVDEAGVITAADFHRGAKGGTLNVDMAEVAKVMRSIRRQRGDSAETDADDRGEG
ncbi:DEAD/DEAH box helicase family protein [Agrobacterium leguminum]|uniref:Helicase-like protein n=1 Tax=Agrobacterium deltaense NCPPB 1641 TaxID=1183425 RepID=A0A1S7TZE6_9HYPH|nr:MULTISPECIES: DEAD/DEAH box helicase family protein [Agrobacterium]WFS67875.1 DEAD/DEAH box helicase family protein [Agrobacterium leguminum]CVI59710.1 Helicase-like protein [Agrobacterium deltaense NCPPB 1641]